MKGLTYTQLLRRYLDANGKKYGFQTPAALHPSLHLVWNMARARSFYSVGFYADKPLDHGYWPASAMDLRRKGWFGAFGFGFLFSKRFSRYLWLHHEALGIKYIIVGQKIISRNKPYWHPYTGDKSHHWHIHISGVKNSGYRPGDL